MAIRAVIFDRDGVLTQFDMQTAEAFIKPRLGITAVELGQLWWQWNQIIGQPQNEVEEQDLLNGFWMYAGDKVGVDEQIKQELFAFDYLDVVLPYDDARPAMEVARQHGLKIGVLSNFSLATLDKSLDSVGLSDLVDWAAPAPVIRYSKPHPKAYEYIANKIDDLPEECLLFEDEMQCIEGAKALNMSTFWVNRKAQSHKISKGMVCDLSALSEILSNIKTAVSIA